MPKILIAIKCCHIRQDFAEASRQTWIQDIHGMDYKIFYGQGSHELKPDEVQIEAPDGYYDLATKIYDIVRWVYEQGYEFLLQLDDDSYVRPDQLLKSNFFQHDFVAGVSLGVDEHNRIFPYLSGQSATGPGFFLSRKAMEVIVNSPRPAHGWPDEPWVGKVLETAGIKVNRTGLMGCYGNLPSGEFEFCPGVSLPKESEIIAEWEYSPEEMLAVHRQWKNGNRKLPTQKIIENRKLDVVIGTSHFKNPA